MDRHDKDRVTTKKALSAVKLLSFFDMDAGVRRISVPSALWKIYIIKFQHAFVCLYLMEQSVSSCKICCLKFIEV